MPIIDQLRHLIIERLKETDDIELLDLVLKLLISES